MVGSHTGRVDSQQRVCSAVLLQLAERLGPSLDLIDVIVVPEARTRDVVAASVEANVGSPAEVRAALVELVRTGLVAGDVSADLCEPTSVLRLRPQGLVEARRLHPGVGAAPVSRIALRLNRGFSPFDGRLALIEDGGERHMKPSGVLLACFYVLAMERPSRQMPITLARLRDAMSELAALGVGPKRGRGDRIITSEESIREVLDQLRVPLNLVCDADEHDRRRDVWFLSADFPAVIVHAPRSAQDRRDWMLLLQALQRALVERRSASAADRSRRSSANTAQPDERRQLRELAGAGAEPQ